MTMIDRRLIRITTAAALALPATASAGNWQGLVDESDALMTDTFAFTGTHPDMINSNENYYDGDMADFDLDGLTDRALGARYGLLMNTSAGLMTSYPGYTNFLLRGMPGAAGWGEDGFQWADVDNDGDYDNLSGGNGEPLTLQTNRAGRFAASWQLGASALNIVNTDLEGDGDVDLAVAHAFCSNQACGGPVQFSLLVNDGSGDMVDEAAARGLAYDAMDFIVGVASGDVDGDGDYDLVIQHGTTAPGEGQGQTEVALNDGGGSFTIAPTPIPTTCSGFGSGTNLGDIDDDGDLDIVIARCGTTSASGHADVSHAIGINDGSGTYTLESGERWDTAGYPDNLTGGNGALLDLDLDGDLDFVALETDNAQLALGYHFLQVFLNDGAGYFTYSDEHSHKPASVGSALGADTDITDLDRDGTYDVWVGIGGDRVHEMMNTAQAADGLPADVPRDVEVVAADAAGVTLRWTAPPFASNARYYKVWRSSSPGLFDRDRELVAVIGERHQDEAFAAPITRHTTTAMLGNPDVTLDGATNGITFVDTSARPGVIYQYAVSHVGTQNTESAHSPEATAIVPPDGGADADGPAIAIVSPTDQDWWSYPRVVAHFADGGSGVDPASIRVSFDANLGDPANGGRAAGTDVSDLAYRKDGGAIVIALEPPLALPDATLVTMTVEASDTDGNPTSAEQQFFVSPVSATLPSAGFSASATSGMAPFPVDFDASVSSDTDGKILRWEWYFGDGTTGLGRLASHTYVAGGTYTVTLVVRDNQGGVATSTQDIDVEGEPPPCTIGETQACYSGAAGTQDVGECVGGMQQCVPGMWGDCIGEVVPEPEICDDGVDGDCDGVSDAEDPDCNGGVDGSGSGGASATAADGGTGGATDSATGEGGADGGDGSGGGCGCRSDRGSAAAGLLMLAFVATRRRRSIAR
jgi:MYXO-CTERM domain-containing protein